MIQKIMDISERELYEFLSYCMYPSQEKITAECNQYRSRKNRELYGVYIEGSLTGIIGLEHEGSETELKHIAVHPDHRQKGLGSKLISAITQLDKIDTLFAETDSDAVRFYEKMGFEILSLGEKYPGVERFQCVYYCNSTGQRGSSE